MSKCNDLSARTINDNCIVCSNSKFDPRISDLSNFIDSVEKDDTVDHASTTTFRHTKENNVCIMIRK